MPRVTNVDHWPKDPSYYLTFDSPDRFGDRGWTPDVGHLHLNGMHAYRETDRNPDGSQINPSYKASYLEVINNPCWSRAVHDIDEVFDLPNWGFAQYGRGWWDLGSFDPLLGRGDPRWFDAAHRVDSLISREVGDPVAWMVVKGYWPQTVWFYNSPWVAKDQSTGCLARDGSAPAPPPRTPPPGTPPPGGTPAPGSDPIAWVQAHPLESAGIGLLGLLLLRV